MVDFSFIPDAHTRRMISNGYNAISQLELWDWLKNFNLKSDEGFMITEHPNARRIGEKMESLPNPPGHSGSSFGCTMRLLEYIAKNGIEKFRTDIIKN